MATRYNENFKIEVVKAYMAGDRSISEIAADYNVAKSTLTGWVKKHGEECQYKTTTKTSQEEFESAKEIRRLANYAQTECQFRYCGTAIPFLTVRSTAR